MKRAALAGRPAGAGVVQRAPRGWWSAGLPGLLGIAVLGTACASGLHPQAEHPLRVLATRLAYWPKCTGTAGAVSVDEAIRQSKAGPGRPTRVRGFLVPGRVVCTEMACVDERDPKRKICCNGCGSSWNLAGWSDDRRGGLGLRPPGAAPLAFQVMDCGEADFVRASRGVELLVSGVVRTQSDPLAYTVGEKDNLEYTEVCILHNPLAGKVRPLEHQVPFDNEVGANRVSTPP
jgi:hypothetical protein